MHRFRCHRPLAAAAAAVLAACAVQITAALAAPTGGALPPVRTLVLPVAGHNDVPGEPSALP